MNSPGAMPIISMRSALMPASSYAFTATATSISQAPGSPYTIINPNDLKDAEAIIQRRPRDRPPTADDDILRWNSDTRCKLSCPEGDPHGLQGALSWQNAQNIRRHSEALTALIPPAAKVQQRIWRQYPTTSRITLTKLAPIYGPSLPFLRISQSLPASSQKSSGSPSPSPTQRRS
jgi:hypothetical protein